MMSTDDIVIDHDGKSFRVRIPIHAEDVSVHKRTVVYEEVDIRRELIEEVRPVILSTAKER